MANEKIVTLVTGANRGMGLEIVKELAEAGQTVILGARDLAKGEVAAEPLKQQGLAVEALQLDLNSSDSIQAAVKQITDKYGYLSILVNNAGAAFDHLQQPSEISIETMHKDFDLNFFGTIELTQATLPLLKAAPYAKIINMSSMMGSLTSALMPGSEVYKASSVGYQASKSALNMFTIQLSKEMVKAGLDISVNSIDPGMVATGFGGATPEQSAAHGGQPVEFGVARAVHLATMPHQIDTATFSNNHGIVPW